MSKKVLFIAFVSLLVISFSSCSRLKDISYLRGVGYQTSDSLIKTTYNLYKVQAFDVLYIRVSSINAEASEMFNTPVASNTNIISGIGNSILGYTVDLNGFIEIPVVGKIYVNNLTINEIGDLVREKVSKYIADAQILVKLLSFKVTLLGEIGNGQRTINSDRANILEVIAMAGDITKYGNRHKVLLLRTTQEGVKTFRIDVTKDDLIASPFFYLQPNDLLYVEPMKSAAFRLSLSEYALFLSAITTTISTYFLVKTISK